MLIQTFKQRFRRRSRMIRNPLKELMRPVTWIWNKPQALSPSHHAHQSSKLFNPQKTLGSVRDFLLNRILYLTMVKFSIEKRYSRTVYVIVYWSKVQSDSLDSLISMKFSNLRGGETCNIQRRKKRKLSPSKCRVFWVSLNSNRKTSWTKTFQN